MRQEKVQEKLADDRQGTNSNVIPASQLEGSALPSSHMERFFPALLLIAYLGFLLWRFLHQGNLYLSFFTDDFFSYAGVARNLADHGFSSFNGLQPTNGYHPLWLLLITFLCKLFGDTKAFFIAVVLLIWLLVAGTYLVTRRAQRTLKTDGGLALACALFSMTYMAVLSRTGMEISLALFLLMLFWQRMAANALELQSPSQAFLSGLLASGVVLSRIDDSIAVFLYGVIGLISPQGTRKTYLQRSVWFVVGLAPIAIYVWSNEHFFQTLLPISGMAKSLKPSGMISFSTVATLVRRDIVNLLFTWPSIAIALLFFAQMILRPQAAHRDAIARRRVWLCVLLQPILFYATLSLTSDWPLWTWYLYVLVPIVALLGPPVLGRWKLASALLPRVAITIATTALCLIAIAGFGLSNPEEVKIYQAALQLQSFAVSHPGRYAMGDRGFTPGYMMGQPMVQLEGLVEDKPYLQRIKRRENLLEALRELGVDYYVTASARRQGKCFAVREPIKAGPSSPAMSAILCGEPVADFDSRGTHTRVFQVTSLQ